MVGKYSRLRGIYRDARGIGRFLELMKPEFSATESELIDAAIRKSEEAAELISQALGNMR